MTCDQCGAPADCRALFDRMLALEFSQQQPWGPLHGLTVSVTALQHPEWPDWRGDGGWWTSLHVYVTQGLESAQRLWAGAKGRGLPTIDGLPHLEPPAPPYAVTIADVAGDTGDFPADGHTAHVDAWARATYEARAGQLA